MSKKSVTSALFIVLALVLAACGSSNSNEDAEQANAGENEKVQEQAVEREMLDLTYEVASIDLVNGTLQASMETNLPADTEIYRLVLKDAEGKERFVAYEHTVAEDNVVGFPLKGASKETLLNGEYTLVLELNVTERTNTNLFEDEQFGGTFADMNEAYEASENVEVKEVGVDEAYIIKLTSTNTATIDETQFVEE